MYGSHTEFLYGISYTVCAQRILFYSLSLQSGGYRTFCYSE